MPSRVIRDSILSSRSLSRVSLGADLLFRSLILAVDDYGRFDARPELIRSACFPARPQIELKEVVAWLEELCEEGCVQRYEIEGDWYLCLPGWEKHRSRGKRAEFSKFPSPSKNEKGRRPKAGHVYFIQSGDSIKIGWSTTVETRLDHLRSTVPDLQILHIMAAESSKDEKRLHRKFKHLRKDREWFEARPELLEFIAALDGPRRPETALDGPNGYRVAGSGYRVSGDEYKRRASQTPRSPALPESALECSDLLIELLRPVPGAVIPRGARTSWAREIVRLAETCPELAGNGADPQPHIEAGIRWALGPENLGQPYEVVIRSGRSLREKWPKLVAAARRRRVEASDPIGDWLKSQGVG